MVIYSLTISLKYSVFFTYTKPGDPYPLIFLNTFSLGGPRAAHITQHFHDSGIKVFLEDNMSPASIADYVTCHLFPHFHKPEKTKRGSLMQPLVYVLWLLCKLLLGLSGWEVATARYYTAIPGGKGKYRRRRTYRANKALRETKKKQVIFRFLMGLLYTKA